MAVRFKISHPHIWKLITIKNAFDGFGDILNLLSFENYVINEHVDILYHYDETRTSFVNYLINDFFILENKI